MHEGLLVTHLLFHQFGYGVEIGLLGIVVQCGKCFQEVVAGDLNAGFLSCHFNGLVIIDINLGKSGRSQITVQSNLSR